ncbi:MAG TPA: PrsW family glutamic-type intramembrane protease [Anaeromyxobacteraceae bacterium]|nr:PrsW family glutamic-type intramembrane protease [Anaeromyxobacteraceae bacterium]
MSRRAPDDPWRTAARGLLGGAGAFGIALAAYDLLQIAGADPSWDELLGGGRGAVLAAVGIGLVEEGAKLVGIVLALPRPAQPAAAMRTTVAVAAVFAALESALTMRGAPRALAAAHAALAPAAHAILSAPLGFAVAAAARRRAAWPWIAAALAASVALHALADLSLASPRWGHWGYAAALLAPVLAAFLHARRWRARSLTSRPALPAPGGAPRRRPR